MHHFLRVVAQIVSPCVALGFALALATPAQAVVKTWNTGSSSWSIAGNWSPAGSPAAGDSALIGTHAAAENANVTMNVSSTIGGLTLTDGMTLRTPSGSLEVNGTTQIGGQNIVGLSTFTSRLRVEDGAAGVDFETEDLSVTDFGRVTLEDNASMLVLERATFGIDTELSGHGTVYFSGAGVGGRVLDNNGRVEAGAGGLTLFQTGAGRFDLDGVNGDGLLVIDTNDGTGLTFNGDQLSDAFSGDIQLGSNSRLTMNLSNGWTADTSSSILVTGTGAFPQSIIAGDPVTLAGNIEVTGNEGSLRIITEATLASSAMVAIGAEDLVEFADDAQIDGGSYTVGVGGGLYFSGPTTVAGGTFATAGPAVSDGLVSFVGETTWQGSVTLSGRSYQNGDAIVAAASTINADVFDMDGVVEGTEWDVNAALVVNADQIESTSLNEFNGVINVGGGISNKLTINLTDPADHWRMDGELNLTGVAGLFFTRVAGSRMVVSGEVNVINADADFTADVEFENGSSVQLTNAGSDLRLSGTAKVASGTTFTGQGRILNNGDQMEIGNGVSLGQAGLVNNGTLLIGYDGAPAQAFVDRFVSDDEARLEVVVGGLVPGTELSHLIVTGGTAQLDGILAPTLFDDGGELFAPEADDVFTILTAPGGVGGEFESVVQPLGLPTGLLFEVQYAANSVSLFMDTTYEADFDRDGDVDSADYDIWKAAFGLNNFGDANGDFVSNAADYTVWRDQLGLGLPMAMASAVPEPRTLALFAAAVACLIGIRRGRRPE